MGRCRFERRVLAFRTVIVGTDRPHRDDKWEEGWREYHGNDHLFSFCSFCSFSFSFSFSISFSFSFVLPPDVPYSAPERGLGARLVTTARARKLPDRTVSEPYAATPRTASSPGAPFGPGPIVAAGR